MCVCMTPLILYLHFPVIFCLDIPFSSQNRVFGLWFVQESSIFFFERALLRALCWMAEAAINECCSCIVLLHTIASDLCAVAYCMAPVQWGRGRCCYDNSARFFQLERAIHSPLPRLSSRLGKKTEQRPTREIFFFFGEDSFIGS